MKRLRVKKKASVLSEELVFFRCLGARGLAFIRQRKDARKAHSSLCLSLSLSLSVAVMQPRAVITKKGNLVVGCKSGRMAVSYDTCSNLVAKHRVLPSIVPHVTHTDLDFSIIGVLAKYRPRPRTLRCQRWRSNSKPRSLNVN